MATNDELQELAAQLRLPQGPKGIEVANMMNQTNRNMTLHSINRLNILDHEKILELGHGNGGHLNYLFSQAKGLTYSGLDISELMNQEALRINQSFVNKKQASFQVYDGVNIPFPDDYFDRIFTVNTLYFWSEPQLLLSELYRVLKPGGILNITFAQERFMRQLPFVPFGFDLYDDEKIRKLIHSTAFKFISSNTQTECVQSKAGESVNRDFTTVTAGK